MEAPHQSSSQYKAAECGGRERGAHGRWHCPKRHAAQHERNAGMPVALICLLCQPRIQHHACCRHRERHGRQQCH